MNLSGKNILISGGGGVGVASGLRQALREAQARVIITEPSEALLKNMPDEDNEIHGFVCDVSDLNQVVQLFEKLTSEFGLIHGLVNNAGIGLSREAHLASEEEFDRLFGVNLKGMWRMSKYFANQLIAESQAGAIVNVSSVHAHSTMSRNALYCTTKNAVVGLTVGMAVELGKHGIRVNAVGPGYVHSAQNHDLIRNWTDDPEQWVVDFFNNQQVIHDEVKAIDVGRMVTFLLSDLARSTTGQQIYVDAGVTSLLFNRDYTGDAGNYPN